MNYETIILLDTVDTLTLEACSAPIKGAGYNLHSSLQTYTYEVENFVGSIELQGTLAVTPLEDDWVDILETEFWSDESTNLVTGNFVGNYVWIRAVYVLEAGIIHKVRCNV